MLLEPGGASWNSNGGNVGAGREVMERSVARVLVAARDSRFVVSSDAGTVDCQQQGVASGGRRGALAACIVALAAMATAIHPDDAARAASTEATQQDRITSSDAIATLKRMHDFFRNSSDLEFSTTFRTSTEIQGYGTSGTARFFTRQPNLFRVETAAGRKRTIFVSDGQTLTIFRPAERAYTQMLARPSMIGTMYGATGMLAMQARIVDFLWTVDYLVTLGDDVRVASKGVGTVAGRECNRFQVERMEDSWDVWLEQSDPPLPCKLVSRRRDDPSGMVQTNEFSWQRSPDVPSETFTFVPPPGSKKVDASELD